jgi:hypothetical protein
VLVFLIPQIITTLTAQNGGSYWTLTISLLTAIPSVFAAVAAILRAASSDRRGEWR